MKYISISSILAVLTFAVSCKPAKHMVLLEKPVKDTAFYAEKPAPPVYAEEPVKQINMEKKPQNLFENAFDTISAMLSETKSYSFERAVFLTENAFMDGILNYPDFSLEVKKLSEIARSFAEANKENFLYNYEDKGEVLNYAAIFKVMTDSIPLLYLGVTNIYHVPFTYDFEDLWGKNDWKKMFVSKLLYTKKGNCHSLPYLYKMIADRSGAKAYLAMAPNHIYIKHYSRKTGMYNTELTSAAFPVDAWLMASGYIHPDAIRNGIYMDTLSIKQSLALCLFDLAKGFERKYGTANDNFMLKCIDKALLYYPNYMNALLLKSELLKRRYEKARDNNSPMTDDIFRQYESLIVKIYKLGYRKMPEKMYMDWLLLLKENREKYTNKAIIRNFNTLKTH